MTSRPRGFETTRGTVGRLSRSTAVRRAGKHPRVGAHPRAKTDRNSAVAVLLASGVYTLQEIADEVGVTPERIRQLGERSGHRASDFGTVDVRRLMVAVRDPSTTSFQSLGAATGTSYTSAQKELAKLGRLAAVQRLLRWRVAAPRRRQRARQVSAVNQPGSGARGKRVKQYGDLNAAALRLAARPEGTTATEIAAAVGTTLGSARVTVCLHCKRGTLVRITPPGTRPTVYRVALRHTQPNAR